MAINLINPHTKDLEEAYKKDNRNEIQRLEKLSKDFVTEQLEKNKSDLDTLFTKQVELEKQINESKSNEKTKWCPIYKQTIEHYREIIPVLEKSRELKKMVRDIMDARRKNNNDRK